MDKKTFPIYYGRFPTNSISSSERGEYVLNLFARARIKNAESGS